MYSNFLRNKNYTPRIFVTLNRTCVPIIARLTKNVKRNYSTGETEERSQQTKNKFKNFKIENLRSEFTSFPEENQIINWYPGHMAKTVRLMREKLKNVDFVLEIRDARIPFTSKNDMLEEIVKSRRKNRMIIFNKADLANPNFQKPIRDYYREQHFTPVLFTNAVTGKNIDKIVSECLNEFHVVKKFKSIPYLFMIVGMPNVGKSSIINAMKKLNRVHEERTAQKGPNPGVTRQISSFFVCKKPQCLLIDTPGVMIPKIETPEAGYKLAITAALRDIPLGDESMADYILFLLNQRKMYKYAELYKLPRPSDDIQEVLQGICKYLNAYEAGGEFNLTKAARRIVSDYRSGKLGKLTLDDVHKCIHEEDMKVLQKEYNPNEQFEL